MIELLGQSPINSAVTAGRSSFISIFRRGSSRAFSDDPGRYFRAYTSVRGILIDKKELEKKTPDFLKGHYFQFNPQTISDVKSTIYATRGYANLPYNDYIWSGGGERIISFQLFLDNTPQSKQRSFRPEAYGSKLANEIKTVGTGFSYSDNGQITDTESSNNPLPSKGPSRFEYVGDAFSNTRVDERGILPEVEKIMGFMYPAPLVGESTPKFAEGGVVSTNQFRPPATVVFALGPLYLEGVIKSAPVQYTLFDQDLTPLRGTIDIELAVLEFSEVVRNITWNTTR